MLQTSTPLTHNRAQAAERLGVSERVFDALVRSGRLRVVRAGRRMLIPETELTAFLEREIQAATQ